MIKYSIIVPCYNSEHFITRCIESLLELSFDRKSFEVIFVDDCSTDNTIKTIISCISNQVINYQIVENGINYGPGASRRYGAEVASGEYICFCDSDDWYEPDFLTDLDKEIEANRSELVIFDMSYIIGDKSIRKHYTAPFLYGDKLSYLLNCMESLCNIAVKRLLYLSIPQINIRNGEDLALVPLLIANAKSISHIDKSYYKYVMRNDSASLRKPSKDGYRNMLLAFDHIQRYLKSDKLNLANCIELLGIKTVLYNSTLMAIKGGNNNNLLSKIVADFAKDHPSWHMSISKTRFSIAKILYLWSLKYKLWGLCRGYAILHSFILSKK